MRPHLDQTAPRAFAGALALLLLGAACGGGDPAPDRANVVLFVVDTLRADRLGTYGYPRPTSPAIDAWAETGTVYEANYSQGCWTVPSMISLMSGTYVFAEEQSLPREHRTLAESMQLAGMDTAAFIGNRVLTSDRGFERGFEVFNEGHARHGSGQASALVQGFVDWHAAWRERVGDGRRWFAWIHPMDPHTPYEPEDEFQVFDDLDRVDAEVVVRRWNAVREEADAGSKDTGYSWERAVQHMTNWSNRYDGEVRQMDAAFRDLLLYLGESGELANTLIVLASDHGEKLWEHRRYPQELTNQRHEQAVDPGYRKNVASVFALGHRSWFHDPLWRTPLIVAGPGVPSGRRESALTANLDVHATLLAAVDQELPPDFPGRDLLAPDSVPRERVFGYGFGTAAVRTADGRKLIRHPPERFELAPDAPPALELFDLDQDPEELVDLSTRRAAEARALADELALWEERVERPFSTQFGPTALDDLRALGYLDDEY